MGGLDERTRRMLVGDGVVDTAWCACGEPVEYTLRLCRGHAHVVFSALEVASLQPERPDDAG